MCFAPQRRALFRHLNFQKWSGPAVLYILTWKCASRHNGVHFFDISTSKSGPDLLCFVHFDLEMCFAPQRRALFRHLNFQKWSENGVFYTFWLWNVLRATTACAFSTSQLPKPVRRWGALYILTSKCASRHNGVQFFISHLASWLRTRRFSEPTFRPSGATNHWKNTVSRDFPTFSRICIFFLLTLSLLLFSLLIFSLLSASTLLCFSSVHILSEIWLLNFLRQSDIFFDILPGILPVFKSLYSHSIWPTFFLSFRSSILSGKSSLTHSIWHVFRHAIQIFFSDILSDILSGVLAFYLAFYLTFYLRFHLAFFLAF